MMANYNEMVTVGEHIHWVGSFIVRPAAQHKEELFELIKKSNELFNDENFKSKNEFFFLLKTKWFILIPCIEVLFKIGSIILIANSTIRRL